MSADCTFRYAEKCLYDYPLNCAKLERQTEKLEELCATSAATVQGYERGGHCGEPGNPVMRRALGVVALEGEVERLRRKVEPVKEVLRALDSPFVVDGTALEGLAKLARMYYFAKRPKGDVVKGLGVTRQTVYNMRLRLVHMVIKYIECHEIGKIADKMSKEI